MAVRDTVSPRTCWWPDDHAAAQLDEMDPRVDWVRLAGHLRILLPVWWACAADADADAERAFLLVHGWLRSLGPATDTEHARSAQSWMVLGLLHLYWLDSPDLTRWATLEWSEMDRAVGIGRRASASASASAPLVIWEADVAGLGAPDGPHLRVQIYRDGDSRTCTLICK